MGFRVKAGVGDQGESLKGQGFYQDKPEWKDVRPIDSVMGMMELNPVVSIAYSENSMSGAVISSGELSPRVLDLTRDAIKLDAANYTVWQLRRDVLQALKIPHLVTEAGLGPEFKKEFELNSQILKNHPKNYQPWQHEKALLSWAIGYQEEVGLDQIQVTTPKILEPILERELKLTEQMLARPQKLSCLATPPMDFGRFKGFSQACAGRSWLLSRLCWKPTCGITRHGTSAISCFSIYLETFPRKLSPKKSPKLGNLLLQRSGMKVLGVICEESVPMTAFYVDLIDELLSAGEDAYIKDYGEAISALDNLTSIDPIRALYWEFVKQKFVVAHAEVAEQKGCCLSS
ncbi:Protein farnesyltransferase/geranylgeranyltransferase type-1 subunit alpha [Orchesella cincta]|uniref:Protein farnesyltransferase/geranylgeranyltransferase type-1 subunit alpha n=1 Tax=Orchesella cincta TaxID=48709 RepID=A0A1D2MFG4_ORCCI|nr:Protein farnesyltransferase/geranylgeranyltransferase type-1 subunit alpha [Orchesella cincta]